MPVLRFVAILVSIGFLAGRPAIAQDADLQELLQQHGDEISDPSRRTVGETLDALVATAHPDLPEFLTRWQSREAWRRDADGLGRG